MKKYHELLKLARESIKSCLEGREIMAEKDAIAKYSKKQACFVTLTLRDSGELRGCVGSLYPRKELWKDVAENARSAAFSDMRFMPLTPNELEKIKIEISVLSIPKQLEFKDSNELLSKLTKEEGVILQKGTFYATYLPQVWEDMPKKEDFLSSLCIKAGLAPDSWKEKGIKILIYKVEKIKED